MKNNLREQKAITLVALIITIIVLLILAMVSIRLIMNGGIIDRAEKGTQTYTAEEVQEQMKLAYSEWEIARWDGTAGDATAFIKARLLTTYGENLDQSSVKVENGKVTAKISGTTYEYNVATGKSGVKDTSLGGQITAANYGDYINLGTSILSGKPADWRILYNDTNNTYGGTDGARVYAILADYLPNTNAAVAAAGFKTDTVNDISGTYNVYSSTSRQNLLDRLNHTTAWQTLIPEGLRSKCQVKGATTGEILIASYNEKYGTSLAYTSYPYLYIDADSTKGVDTLYTPHTSTNEDCYGYWVASPHAGDANCVWAVDCSGLVNYRDYDNSVRGVCPVVSLPSNIQVTNNNGIWSIAQ